jgi:RecB family exonuclease
VAESGRLVAISKRVERFWAYQDDLSEPEADLEQAVADATYLLSLADALARLVKTEPLVYEYEWGIDRCGYCDEASTEGNPVEHTTDCPWRQARELLADASV